MSPIRLPSIAERDEAIRQLIDTTPPHIDRATGAPYAFDELPEVDDPVGDADMGDYADDDEDDLKDTGP
jgi:hypothetical protein